MNSVKIQREFITRYLLGNLSESEQLAIEEEYFADHEKYEQIREVENELVDDYVRGRLAGPERARFDQYYLSTPKHLERVAFARLLIRAADEAVEDLHEPAADGADAAGSWWQRLIETFHRPRFFPVLAMAMLLLTLGMVWLFVERTRLSRQVASLQNEQTIQAQHSRDLAQQKQQLEEQMVATRRRGDELSIEQERLRERLRKAEMQQVESARPAQPTFLSFMLLPSQVRGSGNSQQLTVPGGTPQVRLQMKLESRDYRSYEVKLREVDGGEIFSRQALKSTGSRISVKVPARRLTRGDYILTLSGVNPTGETAEINRYFFRVQ